MPLTLPLPLSRAIAKAIAMDNRDAIDTPRRLGRRLLHGEIVPSYQNLYTEGASAPTEANGVRVLKTNQPCAVSVITEASRHGLFGFGDLRPCIV